MRDRGFALLIVLWSLSLLALLGIALTAMGRSEIQVAANARDAAAAEAAADGGVQRAIYMVTQGAWMPDGNRHALRIGQAVVAVRVSEEIGKINPNTATVATLQALLTYVGVGEPRASSLATAIVDWRIRGLLSLSGGQKVEQYRAARLPYGPANRPFDSVGEIGLVLGMTDGVLARLKPLVSIYQEQGAQLPMTGVFASADAAEPMQADVGERDLVAMIEASAMVPGGARFSRRAVVRLKVRSEGVEAPFQVLSWDTPDE